MGEIMSLGCGTSGAGMRVEFHDGGEYPISAWMALGIIDGEVVVEAYGVNKPCVTDKNGKVIERDRDGIVISWAARSVEHNDEFMPLIKTKFAEMTWALASADLDRQLFLKRHGWRCRCINAGDEYVFGWRRDGKNDGFAVWRDGSYYFTVPPEW